jgi:predicted nucleic acid-binding protein
MLIRINPEMFTRECFNCATTTEVQKELSRTQKFKTKYPWRNKYKKYIKPLKISAHEDDQFKFFFKIINNTLESGIINKRTRRLFNLSFVDKTIAAYAIRHKFKLSSTDQDLVDFVNQEYNCQTITPLEIINDWLKAKLITWDNDKQVIFEDWRQCNERKQTKPAIKEFELLSAYKFGSIKRTLRYKEINRSKGKCTCNCTSLMQM